MPSITIDYPQPGTPVGNNFDCGGTISESFTSDPPTERTLDPSVECWMTVGTARYDAATTMTSSDWHGVFTDVPAGNGYTLHAQLHIGGNTFDAPDVSGLGVITVPGGVVTVNQTARAASKPTAKDAKAAAVAAHPAPKPIHIHHRVSFALIANWALILRSISATYIDTNGNLLTRVFDGKINVQDGDFEIHMDLRQALGQQGSIKCRAELWPNLVVPFLFQTNLIVVDD